MNSRGLILIVTFALVPLLPGFGCQAASSSARAGLGVPEQAGQRSATPAGDNGARQAPGGFPVPGGIVPPGVLEKMREEGVKRVNIRTDFVRRGGRWQPTRITVSRIVYFSKHSLDCSQITDPAWLARIRASGLQPELEAAAICWTEKGRWMMLDERPHTRRGVGSIALLDNGRFALPARLTPAPRVTWPLAEALDIGDVALAKALLRNDPALNRTAGVLATSLIAGDPCMTTVLLRSGISPNLRDQWGRTPLMLAAGYGAVGNVKVLLAAGADPNAKTSQGETALSIANRYHHEEIVRLLEEAGARH